MRFMVGLPQTGTAFVDRILENRERIYEVYFSWGDFANGRNSQLLREGYTAWELQKCQVEALSRLSAAGIALNLLFNADCYGRDSQSRAFFRKIGTAVDYIRTTFGLASVTTTSPLIAKFIKENFTGMEVRASVNMEIGTVQGMEYLSGYFDSYYIQREYNREFDRIRELKAWSDMHGRKLFLLANSGCLNHCSAHHFHDTLVAHESEIAEMDNAYHFTGICREYLKDRSHYEALIRDTNFIRPEDIPKYEPYVEAVKLATRVHRAPSVVLKSYLEGRYSGDILKLLEPEHSIYPYVIENGDPLRLVRLADDGSKITEEAEIC